MMKVNDTNVSCPKCGWEPDEKDIWVCDECKTRWNTFQTRGKCPGCGKVFIDTQCSKQKGGCGELSLNAEWFQLVDQNNPPEKRKFVWFWNKERLPIIETERQWIENGLLTLSEVFGSDYFKSLSTITPDKKFFDREFDYTVTDAVFIIEQLMTIMQIDSSNVKMNFFSNPANIYSGGLVTVNSFESDSLVNATGLYFNNDTGEKEIWLEARLLQNTQALTMTLAHELAHHKLLGERRRLVKNDERLTDLTAISWGFGIFFGNAQSYLQQPSVAYSIAWLAHYRDEDILWKQYLNQTTKKYFEKSYTWIEQNKENVKWNF